MITSSSCHCPFCSPSQLSLDKLSWSHLCRNWRTWFVILLLVARGGLGSPVRERRQSGGDEISDGKDGPLATLISQKVYVNSSLGPQCDKDQECYCFPIGKCKRCSRLDLSKQLAECLVSGFKQLAYCPNLRKERHISCHFVENPREPRLFWLFQGSSLTIGLVAYSIVYLRLRKIERMVARRIQQQINA